MRTYCIQIVFELLEPLPLQSEYNRGCLSQNSHMNFQMLAIWAAQAAPKKNCVDYEQFLRATEFQEKL
jgi:hypothetical protein